MNMCIYIKANYYYFVSNVSLDFMFAEICLSLNTQILLESEWYYELGIFEVHNSCSALFKTETNLYVRNSKQKIKLWWED